MEIVFQQPYMLALFIFLPVLIVLHFYFFEHNKLKAMKFANFSAMRRVTGVTLISKNTSQLLIRLLSFSLLILSAAQPSIWYTGKVATQSYVLAIDTSASMINDDVLPTRLDVAKYGAESFIKSSEGMTKIGLVSFAGATLVHQPVTGEAEDLLFSLNNVDIQLSGGTDMGSALISAVNLMAAEQGAKVIVLMSDGTDTSGRFIDESLSTALDYVRTSHAIVHTIGIGTNDGGGDYIGEVLPGEFKEDALKQIAMETGGSYFSAASTAEMQTAIQQIDRPVETGLVAFRLTSWLLAAASLMLLFEWGMLNTRFRAIP